MALGQGRHTYNIQHFSAQSPKAPCNIRIEGVAPAVKLIGLKVYGTRDVGTTSGFIAAIQYAVDHRVNVLSQSFGNDGLPDVTTLDALDQADNAAVRAGVTVVVSTGDSGPFNMISTPATDPDVLSVGASTDFRFYAMTNYAEADQFARTGWLNDNISPLSSGGFDAAGRTLDMVAPGDLSFASCSTDTKIYSGCTNFLGRPSGIEESGGTSQSAPLTAGAAALVIQAYRKSHGCSSFGVTGRRSEASVPYGPGVRNPDQRKGSLGGRVCAGCAGCQRGIGGAGAGFAGWDAGRAGG